MPFERWLLALRARLRSLLAGEDFADAVDEELQFHLDQQITAGVAAGMDPHAARLAALQSFGGVQQRREECRELHRLQLWESLRQDVRYALRTARRSRGFAVGAVIVLALGIGANTAVFSVVNAVLLEPLPYPEPDRLVQLISDSPMGRSTRVSVPRFMMWREQTSVFQQIAAWHAGGPGINLTAGDRLEHLSSITASGQYFEMFGATLLAGRTFSAAEDRPGGGRVVVLSHGLWRRRFTGDTSILGRTIVLGGSAHEVIGVMSPAFVPDQAADVWLPLQADPYSIDQTAFLNVAARLAPGADIDLARTQVGGTMSLFRQKYPQGLGPHEAFAVLPLADVVVGHVRPALQVLSGAVGFVLLISCANAASLLLSRASRRRAEIATRAALGARRERLVRQLLSESLLLALAGGVLGLAIGIVAVRGLVAWTAAEIPRLSHGVPIDWRVLTFTLTVSGLTGLVFGLLPALSASRVDLTTAFKKSSETTTPAGQRRAHAALVIAEMVLALVLLIGAGLMIRTFIAQRSFDRGFSPDNVMAMEMALDGGAFDTSADVTTLVRNVGLRLQERGSISALAAARSLPTDAMPELPFRIAERGLLAREVGGAHHGSAAVHVVSPGYFRVFQIRLVRGRRFTDLDAANGPAVAIINESMARKYWMGAPQMELREKIFIGGGTSGPTRQIVGIVGDVRDPATGQAPGPLIYLPIAQASDADTAASNRLFPLTWSVRTSIDPRQVAIAIQEELRGASGGIPVARTRTMTQVLAASTARTGVTMLLLTVFAGLALVLAATGMYALMAYSVEQRTQEIGIRIAFGASPAEVRNSVVLQSIRLAAAGVAIGIGASLLLTRLMVTLVFGIETWDPLVFASVAALLTIVSLAAAYVPALRATRVSPLEALRGT